MWESLPVLDAEGAEPSQELHTVTRTRMHTHPCTCARSYTWTHSYIHTLIRACTRTRTHMHEYMSHPGHPDQVADVPHPSPGCSRTFPVHEATRGGNGVTGVGVSVWCPTTPCESILISKQNVFS